MRVINGSFDIWGKARPTTKYRNDVPVHGRRAATRRPLAGQIDDRVQRCRSSRRDHPGTRQNWAICAVNDYGLAGIIRTEIYDEIVIWLDSAHRNEQVSALAR